MMPVISFDLDGTIVKPDFNELIWLKVVPSLYARKYGITFEEAKNWVTKAYSGIGEGDVRWYRLDFWLERFQLDLDQNELLEKYADKVEVYPEVVSVLKRLRWNFRMVISSGMSDEFIAVKLRKCNLEKYFDQMFSAASFLQVVKNVRFYRSICAALNLKPDNLIHIGDHYQMDYLIPRQVGIDAYYLDRDHSNCRLRKRVGDLAEFAQKLGVSVPTDSP